MNFDISLQFVYYNTLRSVKIGNWVNRVSVFYLLANTL